MKADGGFVEHVQDPGEPTAELGSKPYPLHLAAAQRVRRATETEVAQTHLLEEREAAQRFVKRRLGDDLVTSIEGELLQCLDGLRDALIEERRDRQVVDGDATGQW